ncbi:hypothetical protein KVR01_009024 [Diaporthe batatas]|uniref:uncharacterized protein n=1 Tax=Diaporthe batatas TaxID=748121 RepID=UPI001D04B7C8|nr:uncharacterized protein KVR01_009024 [Diaporthe batatas]KAG8160760.1 hypothetical protein KVR01_009024 [Diaporthe batatas]
MMLAITPEQEKRTWTDSLAPAASARRGAGAAGIHLDPFQPPNNFPRLGHGPMQPRPYSTPQPQHTAPSPGPSPGAQQNNSSDTESEKTRAFTTCLHNGLASVFHGVRGSWTALEQELEEQRKQNGIMEQTLGLYKSDHDENKELRKKLRGLSLDMREQELTMWKNLDKLKKEQIEWCRRNEEADARIRELEQQVADQRRELDIYEEIKTEEGAEACEESEDDVAVKKEP